MTNSLCKMKTRGFVTVVDREVAGSMEILKALTCFLQVSMT